MKRILSFILAVCLVLTLAPVVIYAAEPTLGEATLIADYILDSEFLSSDFGNLVVTDLTTENDAFNVSTPAEGGIRIERNANAGASSSPVGKLVFNFGKVIDAEKGIYQLGLQGTYAIDLTFKAKITKATGKSGRTDCYLTGTLNNAAEDKPGNFRINPDGKVQKDNSGTKFTFKNKYTEEYNTYRVVVDTVNDKLYGYDYIDGEFVYTGEDTYAYDSIASFAFAPRDAFLAEGAYVQFKDIKVYEIEDKSNGDYKSTFVADMPESFNYVSGGVVDTASVVENIAFPESWADYTLESSDTSVLKTTGKVKGAEEDKEVTLTVTGNSDGVYFSKKYKFTVKAGVNAGDEPDEPEDLFLGGKLLFDYDLNKEFAESELGKQVVVDNFYKTAFDFDTTYTDDGITVSQNGDPVFTNETMTSGSSVDAFGLNLAKLMENDTVNGNRLYKTGFSGRYAMEFTINVNRSENWKAGTNGSSGRADLYIGNAASTFEDAYNINIRFSYKSTTTFNATMSGSSSISMGSLTGNTDTTIRVVVDTNEDKFYMFVKEADGTYTEKGVADYPLDSLTYMWYRVRTFCENGDSITFKNIKLFEIKKDDAAIGEAYYTATTDTLPDTFKYLDGSDAVFNNIEKSIAIPEVFNVLNVETSDKKLLATNGVVQRNNYEDENVTLNVSGDDFGVYFNKIYDFVIKARDDIRIEEKAKYNYSSDDAEFIDSGNNQITPNGFEIVNNKFDKGTTVGLLKSKASENTYIYDYNGAYDFEIDLITNITSGKAYVAVGNYNADTGLFEAFATMNVTNDGVKYSNLYDDVYITDAADEYKLKFRIDTMDKALWVWANGATPTEAGYSYESDKPLNAYRVYFENAGENDSVILKNSVFTQLIPCENADVTNVVKVADSIIADDLVGDVNDAYGNITLPKKNGYNIEWSTDNALADLENKKIYRSDSDEAIVLTAIISSNTKPEIRVKKHFYLKVKGTSDVTELVKGALSKITPEYVTDQKLLVADLKLPSVTEEGYAVTWESLSNGYISDKGVINKNVNIDKNTNVTFKVTVSLNNVSEHKNITFKLAKRGADVVLTPADITEAAEGVVTYKATVSGNGTAYLKDDNGNNIIGFNVSNSKLSVDYKNTDNAQYDVNSTFEIAVVMNTKDMRASVLVDGKVVVDYVPYLSGAGGFKNVVANGITLATEKVVFDGYSLLDYNLKLYKHLDAFENVYVAQNRTLKTDAIAEIDVKWSSSDEDVMTNKGIYKYPLSIRFFDMTLTMTTQNGEIYSKLINCVALPDESKNLMKGDSLSSDLKEDAANGKFKLYDDDLTSYLSAYGVASKNHITIDLGASKEVNRLYFFQPQDSRKIKSCDIYLSEDGVNFKGPVASPVFTDLESFYAVFDYQNARYIKVTNIVAEGNEFVLYELKAYLDYTSDNKAAFDIEALEMPGDYNLKVTSINLPTVGSVYGSTLTWASTKPDVISTKGTVTKADVATEVVLTVTAEFEGKTATKNFTYLVPAVKSGGSGGGAGGGGGGYAGNISGINAGGAGLAATPTQPEVELEKVEKPVEDKGIFKDTSKDAWYYNYLTDLVDKGIVNGYEDGSFKPNNQVTREEFLKMLIEATGTEITDKSYEFKDVKADDWYAPYVYTAKANGIANGISDAEFGAGMSISRQDMCVMIYNVTGVKTDLTDNKFTDHSAISNYAFNAVYAMKTIGLVDGYENGEFKPSGKLTRAEAVKVISLVIKMQQF